MAIGIFIGNTIGNQRVRYWTPLLEYTSRSGLGLLETKSGSNLNATILPACGLCDANNYGILVSADFGITDASGYVEARIYYDGNSANVSIFASGDTATSERYCEFKLQSGKPRMNIMYPSNNRVYQTTNALSIGWHTIRYINSGSAYSINVDGSPVAGSMQSGANDGAKWFNTVLNRDNICIGTVRLAINYPGTGHYCDYVDYNGTNKWIVTGLGTVIFDVIGGKHITWTGSAHLIYFAGGGQYMMDSGYSLWNKTGSSDQFVPYTSAGSPMNVAATLTGYRNDRNYPGSAATFNKAPALVGYNETSSANALLAMFDRSNTTISSDASRASSYYSATSLATKSRFHSFYELATMDLLKPLFKTGYEYTFFPVQNTMVMPVSFTSFVVIKKNLSAGQIRAGYIRTNNNYPVWALQGTVLSASTVNDDSNVFEPNIVYEGNPQILTQYENVFKMWHSSGWDNPDINYAESPDGKTWTRYNLNPILELHARSSIVIENGVYYLYTSPKNDPQIDLYTSNDGINFTLHTAAIITPGSAGAWDSVHVANSTVLKYNGTWYMLYDGFKTVWAIGLATSPDGITWTKSGSNPVISEASTVGAATCLKVGSVFYIWALIAPSGLLPTDFRRYKSSNLTSWARDTSGLSFWRTTADEGVGVAVAQIGDPFLLEVNGQTWMYYTATTDGSAKTGNQHIKLAIANMTMAELVTTEEGVIV